MNRSANAHPSAKNQKTFELKRSAPEPKTESSPFPSTRQEGSEEEKQSRALQETLQQIKRTEHATNGKDKDVEELSRILEERRQLLSSKFRQKWFLKEEIPGLVDAGYEGDVPVMKVHSATSQNPILIIKVSPPDERDSQMRGARSDVPAGTGIKSMDGLIPNAQGNFDDDDDEDAAALDKDVEELSRILEERRPR
ncbi:hypothetical protein AK812_SmicGene19678 [Symbiodinium microadriaticum]|uniref:Uncharacterized protein n=1 Tax=Symbiodinium microadriaticum TaxID=2951 RepID=A0A1Q9DRX8_SYMMI|nr:hypothetical protein AK812_SmicGene19678 [Symbiodinium microadriaticum]